MNEQQVNQISPNTAQDILSADAGAVTSKESSRLLPVILSGAMAACIGAAIWAAVTVVTSYQIGWMAVGVGFLVGLSVKAAGKGGSQRYAFVAAIFALLGCVLGNLLSTCGFVALQEATSFWQILTRLNPEFAIKLMQVSFSPMDILFYGIAVYEAYKLPLRM